MSGVQILTTKGHEDSPGEEPSVLHVRLDKKGLNGSGVGMGWCLICWKARRPSEGKHDEGEG